MSSPENPDAGQGMVVLDIGGDIGAAVISAPASLAGAEIEICPAGARGGPPDEGVGWWEGEWRSHGHEHEHDHARSPGHSHSHSHSHSHEQAAWPHVAVLARPTPAGVRHAAVFPSLRAGTYELWLRPDGATALTVAVTSGEVAFADWPDQR